ncbi:MAG: hypothetical protein LBG80_07605 [Bacteroidales bacterium]|jgi:hypothetical protein|nr:hypothetical protein [Bacteroidales bacterium]
MQDKRVEFLHTILDFILSLIRLVSITHFRTTRKIDRKSEKCVVMGNGPSLTDSLNDNKDMLTSHDLIAVNFMGLSPEFIIYKPCVYVLCDTAFWLSPDIPEITREKVRDFYRQMVKRVSWNLQLYIPYMAKNVTEIHEILSQNENIHLCYYNKTKVEGFKWFQYMILKRQWGMFRAQNVIVAALLLAIYSDYKQIYLMGVDADWMKNLWVDEQNRIRSTDIHFYGQNDRMSSAKMHDVYLSLYYAFKSYADTEEYSKHCEIKIYNTNLLSFVNVFEKKNNL